MTDPGNARPKVSATRIGIWIVVAGVGVYMIVTGLVSLLNGG